MEGIQTGYAVVGDARLYYEVAGEGPPLVMIHAGVADSRQWNNEFPYFARDYRVLRYDMRGYGRSEPVDGEFRNVDDLVALLDEVGFSDDVILMGCSMGGGLALDFALEYPGSTAAVIMVGSGPSGLSLDVPGHPMQEAAGEAYQAGDLDRVAELEAQIWFDGEGRTPDQVNKAMRELALEMNRTALQHESRGLGKRLPDTQVQAAERLDQLKAPTLMIVGEHDQEYMHAAADYVVKHTRIAEKVVMEDAAHLPNMDHPGEFRRLVEDFLQSLN